MKSTYPCEHCHCQEKDVKGKMHSVCCMCGHQKIIVNTGLNPPIKWNNFPCPCPSNFIRPGLNKAPEWVEWVKFNMNKMYGDRYTIDYNV